MWQISTAPPGGDRLARRGNAHRPHEGGVFDLQRLGQADQSVMNPVHGPVGQPIQGGKDGLQHPPGHLRIGLGLLVGEQLRVVAGQGVKKVQLLWDVGETLAPGLEQPAISSVERAGFCTAWRM